MPQRYWCERASALDGLKLPSDGELGQITDAMLLVKPAPALDQRRRETPEPAPPGPGPGPGPSPTPPGPTPIPPPPSKPKVDYFFGTKTLNQTHYAMDFKKLMDEVLQHLAATPGVNLKVRVEIEAEAPEGFSEFQVRTVSRTAAR